MSACVLLISANAVIGNICQSHHVRLRQRKDTSFVEYFLASCPERTLTLTGIPRNLGNKSDSSCDGQHIAVGRIAYGTYPHNPRYFFFLEPMFVYTSYRPPPGVLPSQWLGINTVMPLSFSTSCSFDLVNKKTRRQFLTISFRIPCQCIVLKHYLMDAHCALVVLFIGFDCSRRVVTIGC